MIKIESWMLEELFQHNMASLEKLRHLSLSTATKSIQMKKGLLLGDLSQAELFHTAERTALIMFFEGDTVIRQGDSRRQHGPYAQQVRNVQTFSSSCHVVLYFSWNWQQIRWMRGTSCRGMEWNGLECTKHCARHLAGFGARGFARLNAGKMCVHFTFMLTQNSRPGVYA